MLNPFKDVNWKPDRAARRSFARSLFIGFPCLALLLLAAGRLRHGQWPVCFSLRLGGIGAGAGVLLWLIPEIAWPFYAVWNAIACCVGLVVGNVAMALFFYLGVTGTGVLKRCLGRAAILKAPDRDAATYWRDAPPPPPPKSYFKQF